MSNAWKRRERAEAKRWVGPAVAPQTARRLAQLNALKAIAETDRAREARDEDRVIPVSGPGRRRAKARRNARAVLGE